MNIYMGADHGGFDLKEELKKDLLLHSYTVIDLGSNLPDIDDDYNEIAVSVGESVGKDQGAFGVVLCGTGIGMSMMANRNRSIRAALCHSEVEAYFARSHNNANVLCLGGRILGVELAKSILLRFLETEFSNQERHINRVNKL